MAVQDKAPNSEKGITPAKKQALDDARLSDKAVDNRPQPLVELEQARKMIESLMKASAFGQQPGTDTEGASALEDILDRTTHANLSKLTLGLSPAALAGAYADWLVHLMVSPGKQSQLQKKALKKALRLSMQASQCSVVNSEQPPNCIDPLPQDKRFKGDAWQQWPYNILYQSFLLQQQWWHNATTGVRGVTPQHERVVEFTSRQLLDMFSPSNFLLTNPELLEKTRAEGGQNLVRGARNFLEDWQTQINGGKAPGVQQYQVGKNIACTPGKVVYRNRLIELIQYEATTDKVRAEPIFIVPAWIMKYYILDLSENNSLVKYLTDQGYTVFIVSWKNPDSSDRDMGMEDYRTLGIMDSLTVINAITDNAPVHGVGYCLGGTLLSIAASAMARDGDERFKSLSFLAAQTDFTEAGELMLFINESQISFLEDTMWEQGFLDSKQMSGAFQLLRSNDLVWSRLMHDYLMGERSGLNDLMAWNADGTRMPYRMHSEYLRRLYLNNDLTEGRYMVNDKPVTISDIRAPIFSVGTEWDHVAPWHSVYKFHLLSDTELTFVLTNGGHNAGIVSEPGHPRRHFRSSTVQHDDYYVDPDSWKSNTEVQEGSWWPAFVNWLDTRSGKTVSPPAMGAPDSGFEPLCDAPGTYVLQD